MTVVHDRRSRHLNREPRRGEVVLARAAAAGVVGGGALGALVLLPDLIDYLHSPDPDVYGIDPEAMLVAAAIGALVGLVAALAAAVGWLLTVEGPPDRPKVSRVVAGLAAGAAVMLIAVAFGAASLFSVVPALVAAGLAAAFAPALGYRPRR